MSLRVLGATEGESEGLGDGGDEEVGRDDGGEGHEADAVEEGCRRFRCRLDGQPGLADAAGADDGQQPARRVCQPLGYGGQLLLSPDEGGRLGRQVVVGGGWGGADAFVQGFRLRQGFHPQFLRQDAATGLVLGQGRAPLAGEGQQPHHLPVGLFPPRLYSQLPPRVLDGPFVLPPPDVVGGQVRQRLQHLLAQPGAAAHHPLLELRAARQIEVGQEIVSIEADRRSQVADGCLGLAPPLAPLGLLRQGLEGQGVHLEGDVSAQAGGQAIALQGLGAQVLAQAPQGVAQIAPRPFFGQIAPQQPGQPAAAVSAGVQGQVDQKGLLLARPQAGHRPVIPPDLQPTQSVQRQGGLSGSTIVFLPSL